MRRGEARDEHAGGAAGAGGEKAAPRGGRRHRLRLQPCAGRGAENLALYRQFIQPLIRASVLPAGAEWVRQMHPARLSYTAFADRNPFMAWVAPLAGQVRAARQAVPEDNPGRQFERQLSAAVEGALNGLRDARDAASEKLFQAVYGSVLLQAILGITQDGEPPRQRPGMPMGTRCGALDAGVVLHLLDQEGMAVRAVQDLLYRRSGVLGLSDGLSSDFRDLLASDAPEAAFAVEVFCRRVAEQICSLAGALGGLDGVVFTAGVGENAAKIRARIVGQLAWLGLDLSEAANARHGPRIASARSRAEILVIPTDEEAVIARQAREVLLRG